MNAQLFCEAFCQGVALREVPIGYVVSTPFSIADGEPLAIYLRRSESEPGCFRIEDDGMTVVALEEHGIDLESEARHKEIVRILENHGANYSESAHVFHTDYMAEDDLASAIFPFISMMIRIFDISLMSPEKARNTFLDDLQNFIEKNFSGRAEIEYRSQPSIELTDYIADIVIRAPTGGVLAIYAGTSEVKALEALLLGHKVKEIGADFIRPMVVLESAKPKQIKERTLARIFNSDALVTSMDGEELSISAKMAESIALH